LKKETAQYMSAGKPYVIQLQAQDQPRLRFL
jgi:hypothetical protein